MYVCGAFYHSNTMTAHGNNETAFMDYEAARKDYEARLEYCARLPVDSAEFDAVCRFAVPGSRIPPRSELPLIKVRGAGAACGFSCKRACRREIPEHRRIN